ncbi:hypothetical protein SteCoe_17725 [Stentor coeruleus]|uniref:DNA repair and recombination protein RAD54B n=1 Tax=Stentor coeruleus TaxID=5963 RepID=A0A1R2BYN2_9CILI|nr:hypothetical protein SteCoe_17725 [Stentor coeruleus]
MNLKKGGVLDCLLTSEYKPEKPNLLKNYNIVRRAPLFSDMKDNKSLDFGEKTLTLDLQNEKTPEVKFAYKTNNDKSANEHTIYKGIEGNVVYNDNALVNKELDGLGKYYDEQDDNKFVDLSLKKLDCIELRNYEEKTQDINYSGGFTVFNRFKKIEDSEKKNSADKIGDCVEGCIDKLLEVNKSDEECRLVGGNTFNDLKADDLVGNDVEIDKNCRENYDFLKENLTSVVKNCNNQLDNVLNALDTPKTSSPKINLCQSDLLQSLISPINSCLTLGTLPKSQDECKFLRKTQTQNNNSSNILQPTNRSIQTQIPIITDAKPLSNLCYKVIFSQKSNKNPKLEAGILILNKQNIILHDSSSKKICQIPNTLSSFSLRDGQELDIKAKKVTIQQKMSFSEYTSLKNSKTQTKSSPKIKNPTPLDVKCQDIPIPEGAFVIDSENKVYVEPFLAQKLRPHQKEGVQFMYNCIAGKRKEGFFGCILADSMGLGKTLQAITLLYTLLRKNPPYLTFARKGIIVSPATLVDNWRDEVIKWLGPCRLSPVVCSGTGKEKKHLLSIFENGPSSLLIISYDSFVKYSKTMKNVCQVIICDEGHLLKNCVTQKNSAISLMQCKRRILLTGTPLQNSLSEFYSCVTLINPGILGDMATFNRLYADPILKAQEPNANNSICDLAWSRSEELWKVTENFILRRTGSLLKTILPPRNEYAIFCKCLDLQKNAYASFISSKLFTLAIEGSNGSNALALTSILRKLVNHPDLVYLSKYNNCDVEDAVKKVIEKFPGDYMKDVERTGYSSKLKFFDVIMTESVARKEKVVVVSCFTKTLDMIEQHCRIKEFKFLRLDGSTLTKNRMPLVTSFNTSPHSLVFLLSTKAGGCGLNLIGANRLILYDPDWNPSSDKQAMGRIWRDGQKKPVYIYRLFLSGTIDEKIYQRQTAKENLSSTVVDAKKAVSKFSKEDLKEIFSLSNFCTSITNSDVIFDDSESLLKSAEPCIDMYKKIKADWEVVETEKIDFTEAKKENLDLEKTQDMPKNKRKKPQTSKK